MAETASHDVRIVRGGRRFVEQDVGVRLEGIAVPITEPRVLLTPAQERRGERGVSVFTDFVERCSVRDHLYNQIGDLRVEGGRSLPEYLPRFGEGSPKEPASTDRIRQDLSPVVLRTITTN